MIGLSPITFLEVSARRLPRRKDSRRDREEHEKE
jgi:hypothetical protein